MSNAFVEQRGRILLNEPIELRNSFDTLRNKAFKLSPNFPAGPVISAKGINRLSNLIIENVFIDGTGCLNQVHGLEMERVAASTISNFHAQRLQGPGIVLDSVWNVDIISPHIMYCGEDDSSSNVIITSDAVDGDYSRGTNDVRITGGRLEGAKCQLSLRQTTNVVVTGTKLHGNPDDKDPYCLCGLEKVRSTHRFCGITTAHGKQPIFEIYWGDAPAGIIIDTADTNWPFQIPRQLVFECNERPKTSYLKIPILHHLE